MSGTKQAAVSATCGTCRWWDEIDEEALDGLCRVGRPALTGTIAPGGNNQFQHPERGIWPTTYRDDWCGEHIPHSPCQPLSMAPDSTAPDPSRGGA